MMKSVYMASIEKSTRAIDEMSDIEYIDVDGDAASADDNGGNGSLQTNLSEAQYAKREAESIDSDSGRVGVFDYFTQTTLPTDKSVHSDSSCYYLGPRSALPLINKGTTMFKDARQRANSNTASVKFSHEGAIMHHEHDFLGSALQTEESSRHFCTKLGCGQLDSCYLKQYNCCTHRSNTQQYDEACTVVESSDSDSSQERLRTDLGGNRRLSERYSNACDNQLLSNESRHCRSYPVQVTTEVQHMSDECSSQFDSRINFPLATRLSAKNSHSAAFRGFTERDISSRMFANSSDNQNSSRSMSALARNWRNASRENASHNNNNSDGDGKSNLDMMLGSSLSVVGRPAIVVPQYHLMNEDRSNNEDDTDFESRQSMHKSAGQLEKMQRRRLARMEKQTAGLSKADNIPGFRGQESVDELVNYIDASESNSNTRGSRKKPSKKKKSLKPSSVIQNENIPTSTTDSTSTDSITVCSDIKKKKVPTATLR